MIDNELGNHQVVEEEVEVDKCGTEDTKQQTGRMSTSRELTSNARTIGCMYHVPCYLQETGPTALVDITICGCSNSLSKIVFMPMKSPYKFHFFTR